MSVLIIEEKPPHFTDVEFEYKGIEFKAQICLLDTGKVMISFRVPKNELEQNLCKGLLNSRGTKLDIKINHLPMCANVRYLLLCNSQRLIIILRFQHYCREQSDSQRG